MQFCPADAAFIPPSVWPGASYSVVETGWQLEGGLDDPVLAQWPGAAAGEGTLGGIRHLPVLSLFSYMSQS